MDDVMRKAVEAGAAAMDASTVGYRIELIRLVDGVHTYEVTIPGQPQRQFEEQDEAYDWARGFISNAKALAVLRAALPVIMEEVIGVADDYAAAWGNSMRSPADVIATAQRAMLAQIMGDAPTPPEDPAP